MLKKEGFSYMWCDQAKWVWKPIKIELPIPRYSDFSASQNNEIQIKLITIIIAESKNQWVSSGSFCLITSHISKYPDVLIIIC